MDPMQRDDGIVIREAGRADVDAIADLCAMTLGAREGPNVRTVFDPDFEWLCAAAVAVDEGRVVSTALVMVHPLRIGEVQITASQVEWVATTPSHRGRGLVRDQIVLLQRAADRAGSLVEFVDGIPHFYRRFGYDYGLPWPMMYVVPARLGTVDGPEVRRATPEDLPGIVALADSAQRAADVACRWTANHWRWAIDRAMPHEAFDVAVDDGDVVAFARTAVSEDETWVALIAGRDTEAVRAVLPAAVSAGAAPTAHVVARADPVVAAVCAGVGVEAPEATGLYARLPDPLSLLRALQPELSRRLRPSPWGQRRGAVTLSTYRAGYQFEYGDGAVIAIDPVDPLPHPTSQGGVGVPDDHLAELMLGRRDPAALEAAVDDVLLGPHRDLIATLFPRLHYDPLVFAL